ncbi:MAG: leucyl aminopeptidase [Thermoanaerobaculia bacterium]
MHVEIQRDPKLSKTENLFILLAEDDRRSLSHLPAALRKEVESAVGHSAFTGRSEESIALLSKEPKKITLVGLGKEESLSQRSVRGAVYAVAKTARRNRDGSIAVWFPYVLAHLDPASTTRLLADWLGQSDYKYDRYLTADDSKKRPSIRCVLLAPAEVDAKQAKAMTEEAAILSAAVETARDLGNAPGNEMTPARLAERAREVAQSAGVKCTIYDKKAIEKMKMGGLLAVNRGSAQEPRFIVLEYAPKKATRTVALVGKGITFDSGGISIKPAEKMEDMKFDMCGAAAVIGIIEAAARLELPVRIIGAIPSTENLPGGNAYKPGDIITTMSGKTVEIVNTDAEGRMILSDALYWASQQKPDHLIDFATLTGACVVALGNESSGLFSNDDELARKLIEEGDKCGERLWRLPEWNEYKELIRSEWADMKNSGGRWGGAITAAVFLEEFVDVPSWAHLDIAGTAWADNETAREVKGATGAGVRATVGFLRSLAS